MFFNFSKYKNPVVFVLVIILLGAVLAYANLQTELFPSITFPKIKIIAEDGLKPADKMMVSVTKPLEMAIQEVPDLTSVRSTTSNGACEISAYFNWNANIDLAQQKIESKINETRKLLPANVEITVEKMGPSILPVMGFSLESNSLSPIELKLLANNTIRPFLSRVSGVASVRVIGGKEKEFWLLLDAQKMASINIKPDEVFNAINQVNFIQSSGYLTDYNHLYLTVTDVSLHSIQDIENVIIGIRGARTILLKDVAKVEINQSINTIKINANGKDAVLLAIIKQPNANLISVDEELNTKLKQLEKILPNSVYLKPYYNQADFVRRAINSVSDSLLIGLTLAIVVAIVFLKSLKASVTILITIPITLALSIITMKFFGYSLNIMTIGAIAAAIGLIIDDAIVVMEQIHRLQEENPDHSGNEIVNSALHYLFPAMIGSSISTIVIFIPFFLMGDVAGAYFVVLTNTMIITLVCSFFVTWIGLPVIYLCLNFKNSNVKKVLQENAPTKKWETSFTFLIKRPFISIILICILVFSMFLIVPRLETGFLPEMDEGSIVLDYATTAGTSIVETDRILKEAEKIITSIPEVQAYSRRTGTQMGFFITEPNTGDYLIQLKNNRTRSTDEVINDIRSKIERAQPLLKVDFGQVIGDMLGDLMHSVQPVEIKIFGNDVSNLQNISKEISTLVEKINGTADVFNGIVLAGPTVNIQPDMNKLAMFGITPQDFQTQLQFALQGLPANTITDKENIYKVLMKYPGSRNMSVEALNSIPIFVQAGKLKPLQELAFVKIATGNSQIERENFQSMGVVTARLLNGNLGSVMKSIEKEIKTKIKLPANYYIEYGGAYADQQKSFKELFLIMMSASMLVFAVILFLFKDFKIAFVILILALLGISGSCLALYFTNTALNVGSYTGIIMIVGIIAENAIFTFFQFKNSLKTSEVEAAIVYSISTRLRPKLMTAIGAIMALLPLALGIGTGAKIHQPLAIAVIGGFIIGLPLLLIVLPSMIRLLYYSKENKK